MQDFSFFRGVHFLRSHVVVQVFLWWLYNLYIMQCVYFCVVQFAYWSLCTKWLLKRITKLRPDLLAPLQNVQEDIKSSLKVKEYWRVDSQSRGKLLNQLHVKLPIDDIWYFQHEIWFWSGCSLTLLEYMPEIVNTFNNFNPQQLAEQFCLLWSLLMSMKNYSHSQQYAKCIGI